MLELLNSAVCSRSFIVPFICGTLSNSSRRAIVRCQVQRFAPPLHLYDFITLKLVVDTRCIKTVTRDLVFIMYNVLIVY